MREIKFRAWDKEKKEMCAFVFPLMLSGSDIYESSEGSAPFNHYSRTNDFELMQCTGLKDRYGNEIYEGDIVKVSENGGKVSVIFWRDGSFVMNDTGTLAKASVSVLGYIVVVIGNIYENPELLTPTGCYN